MGINFIRPVIHYSSDTVSDTLAFDLLLVHHPGGRKDIYDHIFNLINVFLEFWDRLAHACVKLVQDGSTLKVILLPHSPNC